MLQRSPLILGILIICCMRWHRKSSEAMFITTSSSSPEESRDSDRQALIQFKNAVTHDPLGALDSWNATLHFCDWDGVTCDHARQRVKILNLESRALAGNLSPYIANLSEVTEIQLRNNSLHGQLPQEIGRLSKLQLLNLRVNSFSGEIPVNISSCQQLEFLLLRENNFTGSIPSEFGLLTKLQGLDIRSNGITGIIPVSLCNISSLVFLSLALNSLEGGIPSDLGKATSLNFINIFGNCISGTLPSSLFNLTSLYYLAMAQNKFHGSLPSDMGVALPNLQVLGGGLNSFTGSIPASLSNASGLRILDFADSALSGSVPVSFGALDELVRLNFGDNSLRVDRDVGMGFITSLTNCTSLQLLGLDSNFFRGVLPSSIANLSSQLTFLSLGTNQLYGTFPNGMENYANLTMLSMESNLFTGSIPVAIGKLSNLQKLILYGNSFSGQIPSSIGNLTQLAEIQLQENNFSGVVPSNLGSCKHLQLLNLSNNQLNGAIPSSLMSLSSLSIALNLARNKLEGSIPYQLGSLTNLGILDLSENRLSGSIPSSLSSCKGLEHLRLQGNFFQGTIPLVLSTLSGIQELDLSRNNLSGSIPGFLQNFFYLQYLNLSLNDFDGEVPTEGVFRNASAFSVMGNKGLCGGIASLHLPSCSHPAFGKKGRHMATILASTIPTVVLILLILSALLFLRNRCLSRRLQRPMVDVSSMGHIKVAYGELLRATSGFSSSNLIGTGGFGSVYKGFEVCGEPIVAVKVFNLREPGASKSFMYECHALRHIRHRNLVKIITACSSVDFQGNEFMALVYEYMPKGNLDQWLHPVKKRDGQLQCFGSLSFVRRLNIAIDVASALEYLHFHCHAPIVHCDLKPTNVLLDDDMIGHVGDFGLARFLAEIPGEASPDKTPSHDVQGSLGYLPPEYGMGVLASRAGDVYSYGVVLLEMFTGKRPTDEMFKDDLTLHQLAENVFPDRVTTIIDPVLLPNEANTSSNTCPDLYECLASVVRIAISCSEESADDRMDIRDVVTQMQMIKDHLLRTSSGPGGLKPCLAV